MHGLTKKPKVEDRGYDEILRKEKKLTLFPTYGLPIGFFIVVFLIAISANNILLLLFSLIFMTFYYVGMFTMVYLPIPFKEFFRPKPIQNAEIYFTTLGHKRMVIRYESFSNRFSRYLQFLLFMMAFVGLMMYAVSTTKGNEMIKQSIESVLIGILYIPVMMVLSLFAFQSVLRQHRDFGLHYSIGCFRIAQKFDHLEENRLHYMLEGLNYYDYYIRRNFKMNIKNIDSYYSHFITNSKESMDELLTTILQKLEKGEKLDLLRYFESITNNSKFTGLLTPEIRLAKIKDWATIIVPIFVAIIELIVMIFHK